MAMGSLLTMDYIISNDGSPSNEAALGDIDVFDNIASAEQYFEHWISEEPGVRFYDVHGERLVAVDHGDLTFHLERTGTFFEGFEDLIIGEARRCGLDPEILGSLEAVLRELCARRSPMAPGFTTMGWRWFIPPPLRRLFGKKEDRSSSC